MNYSIQLRFILTFMALWSSVCGANLKTDAPELVANYLVEDGLPTRGYKNPEGYGWTASSDYRQLPSSASMANNLAFYCKGTETQITEVSLVLSVFSLAEVHEAQSAFIQTASSLCLKAMGKPLPKAIQEALTLGENKEWYSEGVTVAVEKQPNNGNDGYTKRFIIRLPDRTSDINSMDEPTKFEEEEKATDVYSVPLADVVKLAPHHTVYTFTLGDPINIQKGIISTIALQENNLRITYVNSKSLEPVQPNFTYALYNAFGFKIASVDDKWVFESIAQGETRIENKAVSVNQEVQHLLKFTSFVKPEQWLIPAYLIIEGLEQSQ